VKIPSPARIFPFHHGRLSLSFSGTVCDRGSAMIERLDTPQAFADWLRAAGLCAERAPIPARAYRSALQLREAIARAVLAVTGGAKPARADVELLNHVAEKHASRLALDPATLTLVEQARDPVMTSLGRIAADTIELLGDAEERSRLRRCGLSSCGSIFLTPAGRRERRWCSMERCGNRAKVAAFRQRSHSREHDQ
jgi:predicted RNA-binding Zn ribbon-like protein